MLARVFVALVALSSALTPAQQTLAQAPATPAFEVASVKPATREVLQQRGFQCGFSPGGRFAGLGTLQLFIGCAYEIPAARTGQDISGGPKWLDDDLFVINATSSGDRVPRSQSEALGLLRTLLADRFKLIVHRETKDLPMWALVIARRDGKTGPRLHPASEPCAAWIAGGRRGAPPPEQTDPPCGRGAMSASALRNSALTLAQFANLLSPRVDRPVEDRTGLAGLFFIDLQWKPDSSTPDAGTPDTLPSSIFTALQEQLGLKLESIKGSREILVIDRVERPTPN